MANQSDRATRYLRILVFVVMGLAALATSAAAAPLKGAASLRCRGSEESECREAFSLRLRGASSVRIASNSRVSLSFRARRVNGVYRHQARILKGAVQTRGAATGLAAKLYAAQLTSHAPNARRYFLAFALAKERLRGASERSVEMIVNCPEGGGRCRFERLRRSAPYFTGNSSGNSTGHSTGQARVRCPVTGFSTLLSPSSAVRRASAGSFLSLSILADSRFSALYGDDTEDIVAVVLQSVGEIYSTQLGITLLLTELTVYPDSATDPMAAEYESSSALLDAYRMYAVDNSDPSADANHLFTANRGYLDAIGLAFLGTACTTVSLDAAWSDYASGFYYFVQTVAHELGHNLNATHDTTDPRGLMSVSSQVDVENPFFSDFSLAEIGSYVSSFGSCLSDSTASPLPTPGAVNYPLPDESPDNVDVTVRAVRRGSRGTVRGKVITSVQAARVGRIVELRKVRGFRLITTAATNARGRFSFSVRPRGRFYVVDRLSLTVTPAVSF